ncbi:DUF1990 family protein [uncultured Friedmanniella sp.]|uniref:DUF1990 family protein n=1 Tax=uncultured Friedmanniella sp. TaxID=335381 RepID=UPI0035CB89D7
MTALLPDASVRELAGQPLTYPEVGATSARQLPRGYHHLEVTTPVGYGRGQFEAAADALLGWDMHRRSGLEPRVSDLRVRLGSVAALQLRVGPVRLRVPVRVVAVVDEPTRQGFVYGTLPGHPERGEESFVLELEPDGTVMFHVRAFSRAGRWFTRLGGPVARAGQLLVTERYVAALHTAAQTATDPTPAP